MLQQLQKDEAFYFSYTYDLTKQLQSSLQEIVELNAGTRKSSGTLANIPDLINMFPNSINYVHKFAFNHNLLSEFKDI